MRIEPLLVGAFMLSASPALARPESVALDVFATDVYRHFRGPEVEPAPARRTAPASLEVVRAFTRRPAGASAALATVEQFAAAYNVDLERFSDVRVVPEADMPGRGRQFARTTIDAWNLATLSLVVSVQFSVELFAMDPDWVGLTLAHEAIHAERIARWDLGSHHLEEAIAWTWTAAMAERIGRTDLAETARRELVQYASALEPAERRALDREMSRSGVTAIVIPLVRPL